MQEMSANMATLLKSGAMIGVDRPTAEIILGTGGTRDYINGEIDIKTLGYLGVSYLSISAPIDTNDGKFAFAYINASTKNVMIGFDEDESFFTDDLTFDFVIDTGIETEAEIGTIVNGQSCLSLYKREDGKVLLFVNDAGADSYDYWNVKVYISNTGNCTDFTLYSTIIEVTKSPEYPAQHIPHCNMPIPVKSGNMLIVAFEGGYVYDTAMFACCYVYASYNDGLTWQLKKEYKNAIYHYNVTGQMACLPDGTLIFETMQHPAAVYSHISTDDGDTWQDYTGPEGWDNTERGASLYYDDVTGNLYKICDTGIWTTQNFDTQALIFMDEWDHIYSDSLIFSQYCPPQIRQLESKKIAVAFVDKTASELSPTGRTSILGYTFEPFPLQPKNIQISRSKGMAGQLTVEFNNKDGILAPDGVDNPQLLWPNKEIIVRQGYGSERIKTFTGLIDTINMKTWPQTVTITARDKTKILLDHYIRDAEFNYVVTYENMAVEDIWKDLIGKAGLTYETVGVTGVTVAEKTFSWETYADAISFLDEISGYETYCDENGKMNFVWDGRPAEATVSYQFTEGVDIFSLGYDINDSDLYAYVAVYGQAADSSAIYHGAALSNATYWNIPNAKVLRIDAGEAADTVEKCQAIAEKALYLMKSRARLVKFRTIGIPHLQRGDFIQVTETSSTISEIYRIQDISTSQDNTGYTMELTCFYHDAPS